MFLFAQIKVVEREMLAPDPATNTRVYHRLNQKMFSTMAVQEKNCFQTEFGDNSLTHSKDCRLDEFFWINTRNVLVLSLAFVLQPFLGNFMKLYKYSERSIGAYEPI